MTLLKKSLAFGVGFATFPGVAVSWAPQLVVGFYDRARDGGRRIAQAMRILLQQIDTGLYLNDGGAWIPGAAEAIDFLCSTRAIAFCASKKISGAQIVLKFDKEHYDIVLPMTNGRRMHPASAGEHVV